MHAPTQQQCLHMHAQSIGTSQAYNFSMLSDAHPAALFGVSKAYILCLVSIQYVASLLLKKTYFELEGLFELRNFREENIASCNQRWSNRIWKGSAWFWNLDRFNFEEPTVGAGAQESRCIAQISSRTGWNIITSPVDSTCV